MLDKNNLGKKIEDILKEAKQEKDLSTIFTKFPLKHNPKGKKKRASIESYSNNYKALIGLSKKDLTKLFGDGFNDFNSDIWMYRLKENINILKKNYIYLYFEEEVVKSYKLTTFKINNKNQ